MQWAFYMNIAFFTQELNTGGAETQLLVLAKELKHRGHDIHIITYYKGINDDLAKKMGFKTFVVRKNKHFTPFSLIYQTIRYLKSNNIQILHSYLAVPNLYASIVKIFYPKIIVAWGLRDSKRFKSLSIKDKLGFLLSIPLSIFSDVIICNSICGRMTYSKFYPVKKIFTIFNGIDTKKFVIFKNHKTDSEKPRLIKIGLPARLTEVKDHLTFIKAIFILNKSLKHLSVTCIGVDNISLRNRLQHQIKAMGLSELWTWRSFTQDMTQFYNDLDVTVLSSISEGFPNVLAESMSCGTASVSTDAGDASVIIDNDLFISPIKDPKSLASAIENACTSSVNKEHLREQIVCRFSVNKLATNTESLLEQTLLNASYTGPA